MRKKHWRPPQHYRRGWGRRKHPPRLFMRFAFLFGFMAWLFLGSLIAIGALILQLPAGKAGAMAVVISGVLVAFSLLLPMMAFGVGRQAFRRIAVPLGDVMQGAEAIASGDLGTRVPAHNGDFAPLVHTFNKMAEELERADHQRRNLTADIAHELRNPLHIIQGNLEGVLDGVYEPSLAHIAETLEETRLLARLVSDLHTLSLAEAGQLPLLREVVDVTSLLTDVGDKFSGNGGGKGGKFGGANAGIPPHYFC